MSSLTGKVALITGASRGIGRAVALSLAQAGAAVYLAADGTREELSAVAAECRAHNAFCRAEFGVFDLGSAEDVQLMVDAAVASLGRVDILVNNAGIRVRKPFGEFSAADFAIAQMAAHPEYKAWRESQIPLGRWGKPEEVADAILFLASTDATFVHGSNLVIDGGFILS